MTIEQESQARELIKAHYQLPRLPNHLELMDRIGILGRKSRNGTLSDSEKQLVAALGSGESPITFPEKEQS